MLKCKKKFSKWKFQFGRWNWFDLQLGGWNGNYFRQHELVMIDMVENNISSNVDKFAKHYHLNYFWRKWWLIDIEILKIAQNFVELSHLENAFLKTRNLSVFWTLPTHNLQTEWAILIFFADVAFPHEDWHLVNISWSYTIGWFAGGTTPPHISVSLSQAVNH